MDLEPSFLMSGSPFVNQFRSKWLRSAPTPSNDILPGAIIIDVRHGILLPEGRSREELEPVIRDSYRILEHYLHSNDTHESRSKIIKARKRRSVPRRRYVRRTNLSLDFPLPMSNQGDSTVLAPSRAPEHSTSTLKPEMVTDGASSETKARQTTDATTLRTSTTTAAEALRSSMVPTMNARLVKFLVDGSVNGTPSDVFVLKDNVDPSKVHPFRLVQVNSSNATDPYVGTGLDTLGKYWLLPPEGSRKTKRVKRRARRSVPPYYAVNSFALNPAYTMDKNKTYYTVFAKVSEAVLQDFIAENAKQKAAHESSDLTNMYSGDLFNYVIDRTSKENKAHQNEHKVAQSVEGAFQQAYQDIKKEDELKFGTMAPAGPRDEKVEAVAGERDHAVDAESPDSKQRVSIG